MSAFASSSALRLSTRALHQSLAPAAIVRRGLHATAYQRSQEDSSGETSTSPARAHRAGTKASHNAGGPDLDPISGEAPNASSSSTATARSRSAEALADMAQRLQSASAISEPETAASTDSVIPGTLAGASDYSTDILPLKIDPTLEAFVNNLMRDGKKATATRHILDMMQYLAQALHADPLPAVHSAIALAGPLVRMQTRKSGGKNVAVPLALDPHQSRRKGIVAIIEAARKRNDKKLSVRLAREIIAVIEGSSATLARKEEIHRLAMVNRSNSSVRI